jgi:alkylation response protein AidB-like acyl-CoA dehydrogenase
MKQQCFRDTAAEREQTESAVAARFRKILACKVAGWPSPGHGNTGERFTSLGQLAAEDLSVARLVEAHADAVAICTEGGRADIAKGALGVWASDGPASRVGAVRVQNGWRLDGTKQFCSGSTIVDRALITAHAPDGLRLFAILLDQPGVEVDTSGWVTQAFTGTGTGVVRLSLRIPGDAAVGDPGFYVTRPGFWHGAIGVAACWAGGARGLADHYIRHHRRGNPHGLAHLGAIEAECWAMEAALAKAADEIDADPLDSCGMAQSRALAIRHIIERGCQEVLTRLRRAGGPRPATADAWFVQQIADLTLYLQQCHGERDLESLGRAVLSVANDPTLRATA